MSERRQVRRARERKESRRAQFDRVHGQVLAGRTILDMWKTYGRERLEPYSIDINDPAIEATMRPAFYAGAAAMMMLMNRVSPDDIPEEHGVEMLQRVYEELETYSRDLR